MIDLNRPLDLEAAGTASLFGQLQANILKRHARRHAAHLLLRVIGKPRIARQTVARLAAETLTSAADQRKGTERHKAGGDSGAVFGFGLSSTGYAALGMPRKHRPVAEDDGAFAAGMKARRRRLRDPALDETWEAPYRGSVDAILIVADDRPDRLAEQVRALETALAGVAEILAVERGEQLMNRAGQGIEHFGYVDGISQPRVIRQDAEAEVASCGAARWHPGGPSGLLLSEDFPGSGTFGSFLVFRKLEQDVRRFTRRMRKLAKLLHPDAPDIEQACALAVGRYRDGRPLVPMAGSRSNQPANDFDFRGDLRGKLCPHHAHIRKANARGDPAVRDWKPALRIARRAITYGDRPDLAGTDRPEDKALPSKGVGLLFMSVQGSLHNFEKIQEWINDPNFARPFTGVDALIGSDERRRRQTWPAADGGSARLSVSDFVTLRGGEYFFVPSLDFLKNMAGPI